MSNFNSFSGRSYSLSMLNGLCSDLGYAIIVTENECRSAVSEIKRYEPTAKFGSVEEESYYPKGCYLRDERIHGRVYWNTHQTGSAQKGCRQICIATGKVACLILYYCLI